MAHRKHKKHEEHEEHENHERWLITYADMITLLMVLFIVLYAISQTDLAKFEKFKAGLPGNGGVLEQASILSEGTAAIESVISGGSPAPTVGSTQADADAVTDEEATFERVRSELSAALTRIDLDLGKDVHFRTEQRGLVITIVTDQVLFEPGSADLTPSGQQLVDTVADGLEGLPNHLSVEGHTDSRPISTARFPSNWELSVGRATSVLRNFVGRHGIPPQKMTASGYADQRPVASNDTAEGRAANRRVEVVVHSLVGAAGGDRTPIFGEEG